MNQIFDNNFQKQNRIAASLVASALTTLCSGVYPILGRAEPAGFSYDFVFTHPFSEEAFPLIEERVMQWIREGHAIEVHQMVPENGAQFFRHHKRHYPACLASESCDPLISVLKIGDFIDLSCETSLRSTSELGVVKLLKVVPRPPIIYRGKRALVSRIIGVACKDKKQLKHFLKEKETYWSGDHRKLGVELGLFQLREERENRIEEELYCSWQGKGEALLYALFTLWRKAYLERGFELVVGAPSPACERFATFSWGSYGGEVDPDVGLYETKDPIEGIAVVQCSLETLAKEWISSLKFIMKIPKIFGLSCDLSFEFCEEEHKHFFEAVFQSEGIHPEKISQGRHTQLSFCFFDCFGRTWIGPFVELTRSGSCYGLKESLFGEFHRFVALILESGEKDLSQKKHILSRVKALKFE